MRRTPPLAGLFLIAGLVLAPAASGREQPASELRLLHVLVVIDSDSDLGDSLAIDEDRLKRFLASSLPRDRHAVKVLKGRDATRERVKAYYRDLKPGPNDGLIFFYGGHGATDPKVGSYFQLTNGPALPRSELRQAMEGKNAALVVLLTDCCSTPINLPPRPPAKTRATSPLEIPEVMRQLFYQARGTVDVTAATDNASWCDTEFGGIFTRVLTRLLSSELRDLDGNGDGRLTWDEFFPRLQRETETTFAEWKRDVKGRGESVDALGQRPRALALGRATAPRHAVVSLENSSAQKLRYRVRWSATSPWSAWAELPGAGKEVIAAPVSGSDTPQLLVQFEGLDGVGRLNSRLWAGSGKPTFADGNLARVRVGK